MPLSLDLLEPETEWADLGESSVPPPGFVIELPSPSAEFFANLKSLLWKSKEPPLRLASWPGKFWPDVFVTQRPAWGRFLQSVLLHGLAAGLIWAAMLALPSRPLAAERPAFHKEDVIYYSASDYLPPLDTGSTSKPGAVKGDPAFAPQPIISVPPEADNHSQTIVAPPDVKLNHEVPMPNVVAWAQRTVAVPIEATAGSISNPRAAPLAMPVVAPAPDVDTAATRRTLQTPQAAVVAPPPSIDASIDRRADLNIGRSEVVAPAPQLPMEAQRTRSALTLGSNQAAVAPSPAVEQAGLTSSGQRLIALGIHPIATAPPEPPAGNRRGSFAATPQGKTGAGTPDVAAGKAPGAGAGGNGSGTGSGHGQGDVPPGLHVGAAPAGANSSAVAGSGGGSGTASGGSNASANNPFLLAKAAPPRVSVPPMRTTEPEVRESDEEKQVFGDRKFYALTVNMPNLNSSGGSWVIHFAERDPNDKGELSSPQAMAVADPAYPLELMKQNVHGTVTLYAVIHSDGSVGQVRVLRSVDDQLDKYAAEALAHWHFRPAIRNGSPVDLEAVVMIPFRPGKIRPSF